ncbi:unnamed protein product [Rotaria socialis]|uniref:NAD(P)(+)--arginine ADP-ribosyltransferase n=1 Tax=Rotaria socialis TaxID=392032 RepID=A0A820UGT3_9BILA|nr:unnamed protein product [Rotaria socialis]CAF3323541.1 unnamed protein product [Rotaria socialis]CAF3475057.1 unnamed protein product [Rotaria socialis]CAF3702967.1 unnamed protein product [Rotaria socialis]CAF4402618.1 unnamed protein product [Rotaria socialis]
MDNHDTSILLETLGLGSRFSTNCKRNNNQEVMFMYCHLLKDILTHMSYTNKDLNDMIEFLKNEYKDNEEQIKKINKLENEYLSKEALWWYTTEPFIYRTLNNALRTYDIDKLYAMRIFIRDLNKKIMEIHMDARKTAVLKLYRGQRIPRVDFEKIKTNVGGLLSINNFLSTSSNSTVAAMYSGCISNNNEHVSVMFEITADPIKSPSAAYANIQQYSNQHDEEEFLFTMGSVFRIETITECDVDCCWHISLVLTGNHDEELMDLYNYMQSNMQQPDLAYLAHLFLSMGAFEKSIEIYKKVLATPNNILCTSGLYQDLGCAYAALGNYEQALKNIELALSCERQLNLMSTNRWNMYYVEGMAAYIQGKLTLCQEKLQAALNILLDCKSEGYEEPLVMVNLTIGCIFFYSGLSFEGFPYIEKAYDTARKHLPSTHPMIGQCLQLMASFKFLESSVDEALELQKNAVGLLEHALPPTHVINAICQSTYSLLSSDSSISSTSLIPAQCLERLLSIVQKQQSGSNCTPIELHSQIRVYLTQNKTEEAISKARELLRIQIASLPPKHIDIAGTHYILGICFQKSDLSEALQNYYKACEIFDGYPNKAERWLLLILPRITKMLIARRDKEGALTAYKKWETVEQKCLQFPESLSSEWDHIHKYVANSYHEMGLLNAQNKQYCLALLNLNESLKIQKKLLYPIFRVRL